MSAWASFWSVVLIVSLGGFAVLAVVVTVGGWRDLRAMLAELGERRRRRP